MIDFRPVLTVIGLMLTILGAGMFLPALVDVYSDHQDWSVFAIAAIMTIFVGIAMFLSCRMESPKFALRQAFMMSVLCWVVLPAFAALPLHFSELKMSYTDAFFEAMSAITTTGSTVIVGLDTAPPGILLWRSILQWLGGLGIIIMAITILPLLQVGGMQMFKVEAFEAQDKVFGRAAQIASAMVTLYMVFTFLLMMALIWAGMDTLDALNHAMTTIATGGFSTSDNSVGNFDSALIEMIITVGMILGSIPFILFLHAVKGAPQALYKDSQVHWFLGSLAVAVFSVGLWLHHNLDMTFHTALRYAAFNVTSIMTGSGFASVDYWQWGSFPVIVIFMLSFAGGCAGSTTCGIKIFRFQVMYATSKAQIRRLLQPHGVFIPSYNKRPIEKGVAEAVMGFFFLFALTIALLAMALSALGLDFITALSAAGTAVANVGPGLGDTVGPAGNFSTLPDTAKWLLSLGMLLGRLEIYTVLVLLAPSFWRN